MDFTRVNIKPLSVNRCWKGRRFKTPEYKTYEQLVMLSLAPGSVPDGPIEAFYRFGVSRNTFDWDNPVKPFQDILQKKYGFDDRHIMRATVEKVKVKPGEEFVEFAFHPLDGIVSP